MTTGGDLRSVRLVRAGDVDLAVALAGSVLGAFALDGTLRWSLPTLPVSRLVAAGDLDGTGRGCLVVRADARTLLLLDADTGRARWSWGAPPGTFINDHAGVLLVPVTGGHRLVIAATYDTRLVAFDLVGDGPPVPAWEAKGPWDAGFGPSIVAAAMDGSGEPALVLSSRLGRAERTLDGRVDESRRVLGRRHGRLYQAVHRLEDGVVRAEVSYLPDARGGRIARPYGLLTVRPLKSGSRAAIVLASTQVEEYVAVTRQGRDGRLVRGWGRFIEKDWPMDERELRVHADAVADLTGDGRADLVVSLWEDGRWTVRVVDPTRGWDAARAVLPDRVCWGVVRAPDGSAALVVSREFARATGGPTRLELLDGRSLEVVEALEGASVVVADDAPLPPQTAVMARRNGGSHLGHPDGGLGMVVRRWRGSAVAAVAAWTPGRSRGGLRALAAGDAVRVDAGPGIVLVGRADGTIEIRPEAGQGRVPGTRPGQLGVQGRLRVHGRVPQVIVRSAAAGPQLVTDLAGGRTAGGSPRGRAGMRDRWEQPGRLAAASDGPQGPVVYLADGRGPWSLSAWSRPAGRAPDWRVSLDAPLDQPALPLPDGLLALTLRTGVHTLATELRTRADGALVARVPLGAYLHPPALASLPDGPALLLDDHGILVALGMDGRERWRRHWTAAYSLPIPGPFLRGGRAGIVRASGIHGVALLDARGRRRWQHDRELWSLFAGRAAVLQVADGAALAMPRRDGTLEVLDLATGRERWVLPLSGPLEHASVTAGDVDGDGRDELLVGLPDGRLSCVADMAGQPEVRWTLNLGAGIADAWLADVRGDGRAWIVVATADGSVRLLG